MMHAMLTMSFVIPASVIATEFSRARSGGAVGLGLSEMSIINIGYTCNCKQTCYIQCILGYPNPFGLEVVPKCSDK